MILSLRSLKRGQLVPGDVFTDWAPKWWKDATEDANRELMLLVCANRPCEPENRDDPVSLVTLTQDDRKELHVIVYETEHED